MTLLSPHICSHSNLVRVITPPLTRKAVAAHRMSQSRQQRKTLHIKGFFRLGVVVGAQNLSISVAEAVLLQVCGQLGLHKEFQTRPVKVTQQDPVSETKQVGVGGSVSPFNQKEHTKDNMFQGLQS